MISEPELTLGEGLAVLGLLTLATHEESFDHGAGEGSTVYNAWRIAATDPECTVPGAALYLDPRWTPAPLAQGLRKSVDGESWTRWAVFDRADVERYALAEGADLDQGFTIGDLVHETACDLSGFFSYASGPGRSFEDGPGTRFTKRRILVTSSGGLDI